MFVTPNNVKLMLKFFIKKSKNDQQNKMN